MAPAPQPWTIQRVLEWTTGFFTRKAVDSPRLSAEILLAHVLSIPRIKLYTDYQRPLPEDELSRYRALVARGAEHEPIAYLVGKAHFFGLELEVGPGVLIPRPDTETLVENVVHLCRHTTGLESPRILDLCTGSGCIAAALAANVRNATVVAIDISPRAVEVARRNIQKLNLADRVTIEQGDLFEPLARAVDGAPFDILVCNPPYIPSDQVAGLDPTVRDYEPLAALDGGPDGLAAHRRILADAPHRIRAGGRILLEIAFDQGERALSLIGEHPAFDEARIIKDAAGHDRVLAARRT
jgi:release factor glutamine methyltransferase